MADKADERPTFYVAECVNCQGTRFDPRTGYRLFGRVFSQKPCPTCDGCGTIEYVRISTGFEVPAELWRNSPEGLEAEKRRRETGEYPTWREIRTLLFGESSEEAESEERSSRAFGSPPPTHHPPNETIH
jgi:hypothetical protein